MLRICLAVVAVFAFQSSFAVTKGERTTREAHKHIVNLKFHNGMCTGVVLAPNVVLTAAHCKDRFGKPEIAAKIYGDQKTQVCDVAEVESFQHPPGAERTLPLKVHSPDILLLKLKTPLCSAKAVTFSETPLVPGDLVLQAGHGAGSGGPGGFGFTSQVELEMVESEVAEGLVTPRNKIERDLLAVASESYLMALPRVEGASVCHGDSGGPTFVEKEGEIILFGVNGAILPNNDLGSKCEKAYVHLITPVFPYLDWINKTLRDWTS